MAKPAGLRDIKKQRTRDALTTSAYMLFENRGYGKTSIEDITQNAQYAPRTFFLHFASKEDLLFPDTNMMKEELGLALASRPITQTTLQALREWIMEVVRYKKTLDINHLKLRRRIISSEPLLQGREKIYLSHVEAILAAAIAKDLGLNAEDIDPKMIAAAALAVFATLDAHVDQDLTGEKVKDMINRGIEFLEGGVAAISM